MISQICEKKKKPIQRQHENKKHNKTTNGTEGSGGYLRNFLAVSENEPFDWSFGCLAVLLLVIVVTIFVLHTVVVLVVAGFGLVLFFCVSFVHFWGFLFFI